MDGARRGAGKQISVGDTYQSTTGGCWAEMKEEVKHMVPWMVHMLTRDQEVSLDAVIAKCPRARQALDERPGMMKFLLAMINELACASNVGLSRVEGRLAYRRIERRGEASRLAGLLDGVTTEEGEEPGDLAAAVKQLIDDLANLWGIKLLPSQQVTGAKKGEVPRAMPKPTSSESELIALYSILGSLDVMAPGYTLHKLCMSGTDANIFACLVRLALRCG
jgi:hypothetical protein